MTSQDDDGYGRHWDYRVFSSMWTEPDVPESGRRHLTVHHVDYQVGALLGTYRHPLPDGVIYIEAEPASPSGVAIEAALQDAERIMQAFDKPDMIKTEWREYFDHSQKQNRENAARAQAWNADKDLA